MAISDGTDQSKVAPPPYERSTKTRLLLDCYDSDGSDSGIDTNGRQHDDADLGPGSSHDGDIIANQGQPCEDPASPEPEGTRGSERPAPQPSRKRKVPSSAESDSDSTADSNIPTQHKTTDGQDHMILAGSARRNNDPGLFLARLPEDLQCIRAYRTSTFDKADKPYFELECLMQDGQWYWIAESDVQRSVPSAVGTFWGCGPEDWIAPKAGEKETGRAYWKRPLATDDDGVPDALLILGRQATRSGQTQFPMQKIGYPTTPPTWHDEDTVKDEWAQEYERYQLHHADYRDLMNGEEPQFVAVVGHRLNGENGSQKGIQFSCQWTNGTESWEPEDDVQRKYNAAVLTYWQSDAKARRACKVPDRRLRIVGHEKSRTKLLLKVQMVGRSTCDMCATCGKLPCQESSTCRPNVPLEPVGRLLLKWREATEKYLEDQDLTCYNTKSTLKRRSKRLR
ncbi:hypothetical protein Purlil1_13507 [Purpureocillium lilacinum]|uniref:Chromo domain-containing protein n=1 Tax=Purpureocillium lilacinum TaxID=33203 RepID=A0ABR0BDX2_PURLI|nr:hypothetical protein Purlil1_13507 [Purpureocillium lilacinum]